MTRATTNRGAAREASPLVQVGDRVRDALDTPHRWRSVVRIEDGTAYMADGGCMSVAECEESDILLPGERETDTCIGCEKRFESESMIDSGWLYGLVCTACVEDAMDDLEAKLRATKPSKVVAS